MLNKKSGLVRKRFSSFYYVQTDCGLFECSSRGKNKLKNEEILPGDKAYLEVIDADNLKGVIDSIAPRKNRLLRPSVANVDKVIIVSALSEPQPDFNLIDRMTVLALRDKIEPVLIFNKLDLVEEEECIAKISKVYEKTGFPLYFISTLNHNLETLLVEIGRKGIIVLAGPSGVGKTSIMNLVLPEADLKTGEISTKLKRGKHTTRHVELISVSDDLYLVDTPGFSSLSMPSGMKKEELPLYFPEFAAYSERCKFKSCIHLNEPICGVKKAVEEGELPLDRYNNYKLFVAELIEMEGRY